MADDLMFKRKGLWAFILAASAAPIGYIITGPCSGGSCGVCPASGACVLMLPLVVIGVLIVKSGRKMKGLINGPSSP